MDEKVFSKNLCMDNYISELRSTALCVRFTGKKVMFYLNFLKKFLNFVHTYFTWLARISIALDFRSFSQNLVNAKQSMANSFFRSQLV